MIIRRENEYKNKSFSDLFRPCLPEEIVGQDTSKRIIINGLDHQTLKHTLLLTGPAGCGKTTAARIIALGLNCENSEKATSKPCLECRSCKEILNDSSIDFIEVNVGKDGGKAAVDNIVKNLTYAPMRLRYKVLVFDEAHQLTGPAKDLLLKPIEDGFTHVYYIFCTNQPEKLRGSDKKGGTPFIDRCSVLAFNPIPPNKIRDILENICVFEGIDYDEAVLNSIVLESGGIPRKAINWLEQVIIEGSWDINVLNDIINTVDTNEEAMVELFKALKHGSFRGAIQEYEKLKLFMLPENIRISLSLFFLRSLKTSYSIVDADQNSMIMDVLSTPIYESGKVADAVFINTLYKITKLTRAEE